MTKGLQQISEHSIHSSTPNVLTRSPNIETIQMPASIKYHAQKEQEELENKLVLDNFVSKNLAGLNNVPRSSSQTFMGQKLIMPIVQSRPFNANNNIINKLSKETIEVCGLSKDELKQAIKENAHQVDHVKQNVKLAPKIKLVKDI